jgi:hypothetical protein
MDNPSHLEIKSFPDMADGVGLELDWLPDAQSWPDWSTSDIHP